MTFDDVHVHHLDHDHTNNDLSNLGAIHQVCHSREHLAGYWNGKTHSEEHRAKVAAAKTGLILSDETKEKLSVKAKGRKHSDETKAKISAANRGKPKSEETRRKMSAAVSKRHAERRAALAREEQ